MGRTNQAFSHLEAAGSSPAVGYPVDKKQPPHHSRPYPGSPLVVKRLVRRHVRFNYEGAEFTCPHCGAPKDPLSLWTCGRNQRPLSQRFVERLLLGPKGATYTFLVSFPKASVAARRPIHLFGADLPLFFQRGSPEKYNNALNAGNSTRPAVALVHLCATSVVLRNPYKLVATLTPRSRDSCVPKCLCYCNPYMPSATDCHFRLRTNPNAPLRGRRLRLLWPLRPTCTDGEQPFIILILCPC